MSPHEVEPDGPERKEGHGERTASEYRFRAIEQHLDDVSQTLRVLAPIVRDVGNVQADVDHALATLTDVRSEVRDLRAVTRDLEKGMTDVIRSGRVENLKLVGIVVGAFTTIGGVVIGLAKTGQLP